MNIDLPTSWRAVLEDELDRPYFVALARFVDAERRGHTVFPPEDDVFNAFKVTPYEKANVLILGQDPYHDVGQAHGMCFSVSLGVKPPPSLANIYKELAADVEGFTRPSHGHLLGWARQGVLLLNAVLTVRAHEPNSHKGHGWEQFTDAVIRALAARKAPVVFMLWGGYAKKKIRLIESDRHTIIASAHPSPLSANAGFFGSRPFSRANAALAAAGHPTIDWCLAETS